MSVRRRALGRGSIAATVRRLGRAARLLVALAPVGMGLPTGADTVAVPSESDDDWVPRVTASSEHDWIKLDTGEWLKGEIELIHDETVEFDSAQLDDLQIDWDDVVEMRMPREHTFRFTGRRIVTGSGEMRGDILRIRVGDEVQQFERKDFVSMVPGTGRELDYWNLNLSLGLSGQAGNTNQLSFNGGLDLRRETVLTRGTLSYTGNVATQETGVSANNHRATAEFDVYLTRSFYLIVPSIEVFRDGFQNIEMRLTPGLGVGYQVVWTRKVQWEVGFALGYQATRYVSVSSGSDTDGDVALQLSTDFDLDLPKRFEWTTSYRSQIVVSDIDKTNQHLSSTLSFDFWGPLDFDTTFEWDWVASPVADAEGNRPTSSDFRIIVGLALDL